MADVLKLKLSMEVLKIKKGDSLIILNRSNQKTPFHL